MNKSLPIFIIVFQMLCVAMPSMSADAVSGSELDVRTFRVPPDFLTRSGAPGNPTAMSVLTAAGISLPEGASAVFAPATSTLSVKNTRTNLTAIEAYVNRLTGFARQGRPEQQSTRILMDITLTLQGYELPKKDATAILQTLDVRLDASTLLQQLVKARATIVKLGTLKTTNGARASIEEKNFSLEMEPISGADVRFDLPEPCFPQRELEE